MNVPKAVKIDPSNAHLWTDWGRVLNNLGKFHETSEKCAPHLSELDQIFYEEDLQGHCGINFIYTVKFDPKR